MTQNAQINLEANSRSKEKNVNQLRAQGLVPAVLYGYNTENISLTVPASLFEKVYKQAGESTVINLKVDGAEPVNVLIHEVQLHGTSDKFNHVDFLKVNMNVKLEATVPLVFIGESEAVKTMGGTLVHPISEVEVRSLPSDLPHEIEVDISPLLDFDAVIRVEDLKVDRSKVEILAEADAVVALVEAPRSEEELAELETAPVEADVTQVEGVEKKEGEEAPAEGEQAPAQAKEKSE